jgi:hypothetical protein
VLGTYDSEVAHQLCLLRAVTQAAVRRCCRRHVNNLKLERWAKTLKGEVEKLGFASGQSVKE